MWFYFTLSRLFLSFPINQTHAHTPLWSIIIFSSLLTHIVIIIVCVCASVYMWIFIVDMYYMFMCQSIKTLKKMQCSSISRNNGLLHLFWFIVDLLILLLNCYYYICVVCAAAFADQLINYNDQLTLYHSSGTTNFRSLLIDTHALV